MCNHCTVLNRTVLLWSTCESRYKRLLSFCATRTSTKAIIIVTFHFMSQQFTIYEYLHSSSCILPEKSHFHWKGTFPFHNISYRIAAQRNCSNVNINRWIACDVLCCCHTAPVSLKCRHRARVFVEKHVRIGTCTHAHRVHAQRNVIASVDCSMLCTPYTMAFVYKQTKDRIENEAQLSTARIVQCLSCAALSFTLSFSLALLAGTLSSCSSTQHGSQPMLSAFALFCFGLEICCVRLSHHAVYVFPIRSVYI